MPAETAVDIPTQWLTREPGLPDRCVVHGLPAVRRVDLAIRSRPKVGSRKKALLPGSTSLDRANEYVRQVKIVKAVGWPLCGRCVRQRTVGLALAGLLFFGGLVAMVAGFIIGAVADEPQPVVMVPILGGFAAMLVSPVALRWASLVRLSRAELVDDGSAVQVAGPSTEFAAQLPPRL